MVRLRKVKNAGPPSEVLSAFEALRSLTLSDPLDHIVQTIAEGHAHLATLTELSKCNPAYLQSFATRLANAEDLLERRTRLETQTFSRA